MDNEKSKILTRYFSHKSVLAGKIKGIINDNNNFKLILKNHDIIDVTHNYIQKHDPKIGGYYVLYEDGYESWSTEKAFEDGYTEEKNINFGKALEILKSGLKVSREGWNGKGLWLEMQYPEENSKMTLPYIFLNYPCDAKTTPCARVQWFASQTDMLANDWFVLN